MHSLHCWSTLAPADYAHSCKNIYLLVVDSTTIHKTQLNFIIVNLFGFMHRRLMRIDERKSSRSICFVTRLFKFIKEPITIKALTSGSSHASPVRLPSRDPRDLSKRWMEVTDDMAQQSSQWPACIRIPSFNFTTCRHPVDFAIYHSLFFFWVDDT